MRFCAIPSDTHGSSATTTPVFSVEFLCLCAYPEPVLANVRAFQQSINGAQTEPVFFSPSGGSPRHLHTTAVRKTPLFKPFIFIKNDDFTKTGSGQT